MILKSLIRVSEKLGQDHNTAVGVLIGLALLLIKSLFD